ncbi:MAG: VTT domain-containing protein [Holosporales bacterium]|jgi:membrane protein YqaA with SNARE-associated domain|nr:VTT domain-containing protein [Holosporales bacterium]
MLRKLYDWVMSQAQRPHALWVLCAISFAESSFFPIPPDPLLIPIALTQRSRALWYGFLCTLASVLGGALGYYIGYALFEAIGMQILTAYGYVESFQKLVQHFQEWAFWAITLKGLTPIPYKIVTITAGVAHVDFATFMIASVLARGMRFMAVSGLCWYFGEPVRHFIEKYLGWLFLAILVLLIGGFVVLKYL